MTMAHNQNNGENQKSCYFSTIRGSSNIATKLKQSISFIIPGELFIIKQYRIETQSNRLTNYSENRHRHSNSLIKPEKS